MPRGMISGHVVRGTDLSAADRERVLSHFRDRYTYDNEPFWTKTVDLLHSGPWPVQFVSDTEWLAGTLFYCTMKGNVDTRVKRCESTPTWPENPELRGEPRCIWALYGKNLRYEGWNSHLRRHRADRELARARAGQPVDMAPLPRYSPRNDRDKAAAAGRGPHRTAERIAAEICAAPAQPSDAAAGMSPEERAAALERARPPVSPAMRAILLEHGIDPDSPQEPVTRTAAGDLPEKS